MADSDAIELLIDATPLAAGLDTSGQRLQELGSHAGRDLTEGGGGTAAAAGLPRGREAEQATKDTQKLTASLKEQTQTVGLTGHQLELFKLQQAGASAEELKAATAAEQGLRSAQRGQAVREAIFSGRGAATGVGLAGGAVRAGLESQAQPGVVHKPSEAIGQIGQFASLLPGALGSIASTITSVFGSIMDALTRESRIVAERAGTALASIVTGARNASQAVAGVRLDSLTEDLQGIVRDAAAGNLQRNTPLGGESLEQALQRRIGDMQTRAQAAADVTGRIAANPQLQGQVAGLAQQRFAARGNEAVQGLQNDRGQAELAARLASQGVEAGRAADSVQRLAMVQRLATDANISLEEATRRTAAGMERFAQIQEQTRAAQATRSVAESIRGGREELEMDDRRLAVIRDMRPLVADVSQEEQQLAQLRRAGASDLVVAQRQRQIEQLGEARVQQQAAQQGRALTEQTRSPEEVFEQERLRLDTLRFRGEISDDVHARGMDRALQQVERAAGEAPVGQAALQEGSAAAASAILRAQRQMEREDPAARLARAFAEVRDVAQQQRGLQRELVDLVRRGDIFRAVNL